MVVSLAKQEVYLVVDIVQQRGQIWIISPLHPLVMLFFLEILLSVDFLLLIRHQIPLEDFSLGDLLIMVQILIQ